MTEDIQLILGERIRARREALGLSQGQVFYKVTSLAADDGGTGFSQAHLSHIERGLTNPLADLDKFVTLAEALDTTPAELLSGTPLGKGPTLPAEVYHLAAQHAQLDAPYADLYQRQARSFFAWVAEQKAAAKQAEHRELQGLLQQLEDELAKLPPGLAEEFRIAMAQPTEHERHQALDRIEIALHEAMDQPSEPVERRLVTDLDAQS